MFSELIYLRNALLRISLCFIVSALVFFAVPFERIHVYDVSLVAPSEDGVTLSEWVMERIRIDLAPEEVELVTSNPLDPFTTKATLALLASFAVAFPYFLLEVYWFMSVALYPKERRALARVLILSVLLFVAGAIFAYKLVIPLVFTALFTYLPSNVSAIYNLRELISLVTGLVIAIATLFLLPVCMVLLSQSGLIPPAFWRAHARLAILLVVILSAIITPDGSGVSMVLLAVPMCILYASGYVGSTLVAPKSGTPDIH